MNRIKRYKLKEGRPTQDDIERYCFRKGGSWINTNAKYFIIHHSEHDINITLNLCINTKTNQFSDFDNVLVLDESFCQPYTPFYSYLNNEIESFECLDNVITDYNNWMSSLDFLEEKENESEQA